MEIKKTVEIRFNGIDGTLFLMDNGDVYHYPYGKFHGKKLREGIDYHIDFDPETNMRAYIFYVNGVEPPNFFPVIKRVFLT